MDNHETGSDYAEALAAIPDCFLLLDAGGTVVRHLSGGADDPALSPADMVGREIYEFLPGDVAALIKNYVKRALKTRESCCFNVHLGDTDEAQHYEMRLLVQGRDRLLAVVRNVSLHPAGGGRALLVSTHAEGQLLSRSAFMMKLEAIVSDAKLRERGFAVLSIGFERFTHISKKFGGSVGDGVLRTTGERIEDCLAKSGEMARLGGDEFVIVLREAEGRDPATEIAAKIREAFAGPIRFDNHEFELRPDIGIALFPGDGNSAEELLQNARAALDEARLRGTTSFEFFSDTMKIRTLKRLDVKDELKWAIDNDFLELRYLPRIGLSDGRVTGMEALLRWDHPLRGLVSLGEILPIAEVTGLIRPIGDWVMHTACSHAAGWRVTWEDLPPVSVNLSPDEFVREDLAELVRTALEASGLPAASLELELTEAMLLHVDKATYILRQLESIGIGLVIDDFGTGFSSLAHLSGFPLKAIKIDRSFVRRCHSDASRSAICSAIIAMATELGLTVIAEGVETIEQVNFLRNKGCHALQGFFFTEPLKAEDVPGFLAPHMDRSSESGVIELETIRNRFALTSVS